MTSSALEVYDAGLLQAAEPGNVPAWQLRYADGTASPLDLRSWCTPRPGDDELLAAAGGSVLDIGCGPGRLTAALTRQGRVALGIDISAGAVRLTRASGAAALHRSVFARLPGTGRWQTALLADGNIGIGGDPVRLLARTRDLLAADGTALVELDQQGTGRTVVVRLENDVGDTSGWFRWAHVGPLGLEALAFRAGMRTERIWSAQGRWFAEVVRA
jgi:SAM-dependent methyltransferase